jgi:hypothetical protein
MFERWQWRRRRNVVALHNKNACRGATAQNFCGVAATD